MNWEEKFRRCFYIGWPILMLGSVLYYCLPDNMWAWSFVIAIIGGSVLICGILGGGSMTFEEDMTGWLEEAYEERRVER